MQEKGITVGINVAKTEENEKGFAVMESFTDSVRVRSTLNKGTVVTLTKKLELRIKKNA